MRWEVGGGQAPRQPGQVRKEAAVTSARPGSLFGLPPLPARPRPGGQPRRPDLRPTSVTPSSDDERPRDPLSRPRPQVPAAELCRGDRPGGDGPHPVERDCHRADRAGLHAHRRARVGKTTTARIIARALNCIGPDGAGGPTIAPCGECVHCRAIAEDRHVDVIEMDAASHTGVDDMRELTRGRALSPGLGALQGLHHRRSPHALRSMPFNALLKTLEEPPPDVKFVFATTEIRKVPLTVLSRCQRFSLRRVPVEQLVEHYRRIAEAEGVAVAPAALGLIARAADGSVRDGLSLLDQAIALSGDAAGGAIEAAAVRDMLGIADRGLVWDLFETVLRGDAAGALDADGRALPGRRRPADRAAGSARSDAFRDPAEAGSRRRGRRPARRGRSRARPAVADALSMPVLARAWQMLLKGIEEVQAAPVPAQAASMVLIRLAYVADLPVPADLVRALTGAGSPAGAGELRSRRVSAAAVRRLPLSPVGGEGRGEGASRPARPPPHPARPRPTRHRRRRAALARGAGEASRARLPLRASRRRRNRAAAPALDPPPQSFAEVVALFDKRREALLRSHLWSHVHLVAFEPGPDRVPPRRRRAARPGEPARPAARRVDRNALGRRRVAGRRRADPGEQEARAGQPSCGTRSRRTRWSGRCWRPSRGRRSRRCGSGSPRPIPAPNRPRTKCRRR